MADISFGGNPDKIVQAATGVVGTVLGGTAVSGGTAAVTTAVTSAVTTVATAAAPVVACAAVGYGLYKGIKWLLKD